MKISKSRKIIILSIVFLLIVFVVYSIFSRNIGTTGKSMNTSSETEIKNILIDNYDLFNDLASFIKDEPGKFSCKRNSTQIVARIDDKTVKLNSIGKEKQVLYILKNLNFIYIVENDESIEFMKKNDYGVNGLVYDKTGYSINEYDNKVSKIVKIRDNWYYISSINNS